MEEQNDSGGFKNFISSFGTSDLVGLFGACIGAAATIVSTYENQTIAVISILISQVLLLCGWAYSIRLRHKNINALAQKDKEIKALNEFLSEKNTEYERKWAILDNERDKMIKQLFTISNCVKSNNIHNNDMLVKIPSEADEQYELLEKLKVLSADANPERMNKIQDEAVASARKYATQLFELFKRYCRESTDEAVKLQNAYMALKDIPLRVAVTIKLMDRPYHPAKDRSEDIKVYTAFRDNETYVAGDREIGEQLYTIGGNTDFSACLNKDQFIINRAEDQGGSYSNEHRGYDQIYNAAVVVPIRIKRGDGQYKYFGYLCCDCLNLDRSKDAFDKSAAQYLFAFAQNLATFLETLDANWVDRYKDLEDVSDGILEMLFKKIYKPK